ncbi:MAG: hypothetical protein COB76_04535 [Alphaproteobacteria bacterium]|nr:MAG: hypothetical protein COB76_04535 [Alphaproteobacteria bacterium]
MLFSRPWRYNPHEGFYPSSLNAHQIPKTADKACSVLSAFIISVIVYLLRSIYVSSLKCMRVLAVNDTECKHFLDIRYKLTYYFT